MQYRNGMHPYKTFLLGFAYGAVHIVAWIGTVGYNQCLVVLGASLHYIVHGTDVCVETCSNVLNVKHNYVDIRQLCCGRFVLKNQLKLLQLQMNCLLRALLEAVFKQKFLEIKSN